MALAPCCAPGRRTQRAWSAATAALGVGMAGAAVAEARASGALPSVDPTDLSAEERAQAVVERAMERPPGPKLADLPQPSPAQLLRAAPVRTRPRPSPAAPATKPAAAADAPPSQRAQGAPPRRRFNPLATTRPAWAAPRPAPAQPGPTADPDRSLPRRAPQPSPAAQRARKPAPVQLSLPPAGPTPLECPICMETLTPSAATAERCAVLPQCGESTPPQPSSSSASTSQPVLRSLAVGCRACVPPELHRAVAVA